MDGHSDQAIQCKLRDRMPCGAVRPLRGAAERSGVLSPVGIPLLGASRLRFSMRSCLRPCRFLQSARRMRALFFLTIFLSMAAGDVAWWRWADARLTRLPRPRFWRGLLGAFTACMLAYLVAVLILPGATRRSRGPVPISIHAAAFLWHMIVLPVWLIGLLLTWLGSVMGRGVNAISKRPLDPSVENRSGLSRREVGIFRHGNELDAARSAGVGRGGLSPLLGVRVVGLGNVVLADLSSLMWNRRRWRSFRRSPALSCVGSSRALLSNAQEPKGLAQNRPRVARQSDVDRIPNAGACDRPAFRRAWRPPRVILPAALPTLPL